MLKKTEGIIFLFFLFFAIPFSGYCQNGKDASDTVLTYNPLDFPSFEDNNLCFRCHASGYYTLTDTISGLSKREAMCDNFHVSRDKFYNSVHRSFSCTDCHSYEYLNFPHAAALRFEPSMACIDCHGGDETFAKYHFEEIDAEYQESVHAKIESGEFSCWKCHDPHSYVPLARRDTLSLDFIVSSNQMCLNCHGNFEKFQLLSDRNLSEVVKEHDWLPNQGLHFKAVRCIECHSEQNQEILISHKILPKDSAVSNCVECHSSNSVLMASLYKFRVIEKRKTYGFLNAAIIDNDSYVIGANRSWLMNILGIIIISLTLFAVLIHIVFRIKKSKSKS